MDLSALIFVALAVAWAVYLVPKALRHHEEDAVSRSVDRFSDGLRVLARREPVSAREARLVVDGRTPTAADAPETPGTIPALEDHQPTASTTVTAPPPSPARLRAGRSAAARAARRRRRVLGTIVLANVVVAALATGAVVAWSWTAVPATLLVGWLVACRLMVRRERAGRSTERVRKRGTALADEPIAEEDSSDDTTDVPAVVADLVDDEPVDSDRWEPVPMTLPTYVDKASVGRSVRTIDLDSTGVWSSGRNASDSALARQADEAARAAKAEPGERRAAGS